MKKSLKFLATSAALLMASGLYGVEIMGKDTKLNVVVDDEENTHPDIKIPIEWNKTLSSSVEYTSNKIIQNNEDQFTYDTSLLKVNLLKYDITDGINVGFAVLNEKNTRNNQGNTGGYDYNLNFDVDILSYNFYFDVIKYDFLLDGLDMKFEAFIAPVARLDVDQDTYYTNGTTSSRTLYDSSEDLDTIYESTLKTNYKLNSYISIGLEGKYRFTPIQYSLKTLSGISYYEVDETITSGIISLSFESDWLLGLRPTIGYLTENVHATGTKSGDPYSFNETSNKYIFGLTKNF